MFCNYIWKPELTTGVTSESKIPKTLSVSIHLFLYIMLLMPNQASLALSCNSCTAKFSPPERRSFIPKYYAEDVENEMCI